MLRRSGNGKHSGQRANGRRWRLGALEGLEERILLSATDYFVNSTGNSTSGTGSSGTLPYVVGLANANPNTDGSVIAFSPLFNTTQTITLAGTLVLAETAGPEVIKGPVSKTLTISGNDSVEVFKVNSGVKATLTQLTIARGLANQGGGVFNQGTLTLTSVDLSNNNARDGGAIFNSGGTVMISDRCAIMSNAATVSGAGICQKGGAIAITGSSFSNNSAGLNGGGIFVESGSLTIGGSTLSDNKAFNGGGAIYNYVGSVQMSHCGLSSNSAGSGGGGVYQLGGHLGPVSITDSSLTNNTARIGAGVYVNSGSLTLVGSTLVGNKALDAGGGIFDRSGPLQISDCSLSRNSARKSGGGIDESGTNRGITITGSTFAKNSSVYGGGIHMLGGSLTLISTTLVDNMAAAHGAAVCDSGGGDVRMSRCNVMSNVAGADAGAIMESGANAVVTITGSTLANNTASFGGCVFVNGGSLTLTDSTLAGNQASTSGGAIYDFAGNELVSNCRLLNNTAAVNGGGIRQASTGGQFTITGSTLAGNTASSGGGIYLSDGSLTITGSTLSGNTADAAAGGGLFESGGIATITNSTISGNTADKSGGGICVASGSLTTVNVTVADNRLRDSGGSGGGLDVKAGAVVIDNTIVARNSGGSPNDLPSDITGLVSGSYNLVGTGGSGGLTNSHGNQVNVSNPVLGVLADNGGPTETIALLPGSPAIGMGSDTIPNVTVPTVDQRGVHRPNNSIDVGAFQDRGFTLKIAPPGRPQSTSINAWFSYPLTVIVTSPFGDPVQGGIVSYRAPSSGALAVLSAQTATIGLGGKASVSARANGIVGRYLVSASAIGAATSVGFPLTNTAPITRARGPVFLGTPIASPVVSLPLVGLMLPDGPTTKKTAVAGR